MKPETKNIIEWYKIKSYASTLFGDTNQERVWIKKAYLLLNNELLNKEFSEDQEQDSRILTKETKLWILSLYTLFNEFKTVTDFNHDNTKINDLAFNAGFNRYHEEEFAKEISINHSTFADLLLKKFDCSSDILKFMTNEDIILSYDEFCNASTVLNENRILTVNDYCEVVEEGYEHYVQKTIIPIDKWQTNSAYEWIDKRIGNPFKNETLRLFG